MKKRIAILLSLLLVLALSLAAVSAAGEAPAADIGLEAEFASSWGDYSVTSDQYVMMILTIHTDLDLSSIRRADTGETLPWSAGITRTMKNKDGEVTEKTWIFGIDKAEAELETIVVFSDGSEYPIPHGTEAKSEGADEALLGAWSFSSYGGTWYVRFSEDSLRMAIGDSAAVLDEEGRYTELPVLWQENGTVWVVITPENSLPILEMNEKPVTTVIEDAEATVVPFTYVTGESGATLSYQTVLHGEQSVRLEKAGN